MHKLDSVETILARLMPPALSQDGQREIESMLDALAGAAVPEVKPAGTRWHRLVIAGGIAATGMAAALIFPMATAPSPASWAATTASKPAAFGLVLVGESDRIESMTDEGWHEDADGATMRAMRLNVVEENSLLDEETGIVMQVSEPREEILLMPISTF